MIVAMCPVDTRGLPSVPGVEIPKPSIEHSLRGCDHCGRQCWIGPTQLFKVRMSGAPALCYWCIMPTLQNSAEINILALDRTADDKPRRT